MERYTALLIDHTDTDPDDTFSSVPYEKGFNFLVHLESVVGGEHAFAPFFLHYIAKHQYGTVTSTLYCGIQVTVSILNILY